MDTTRFDTGTDRNKKAPIADAVAVLALRIIFIIVAGGVGTIWAQSQDFDGFGSLTPFLVFSGVLIVAFGVVAIDMLFPRKRIEVISAIYFGLLIGLMLSYLLTVALTPFLLENRFKMTTSIWAFSRCSAISASVCCSRPRTIFASSFLMWSFREISKG